MKKLALSLLAIVGLNVVASMSAFAGPYAPAAGQPGSTAIANTNPAIAGWATGFRNLVRGPQNITSPGGPFATAGAGNQALGFADGNAANTVSLGDGGSITLSFALPITNAAGYDFAVYENSFSDTFLELAFVEVSSNGSDFLRFPVVSLTPTGTQVSSFGALDPTNLDNLAGKYRAGFGTPFDLDQLAGLSPLVDVANINFVRVVDVIGTVAPAFGAPDSLGNFVNDPYPTAFASGGFDLDGIAVLHQVPEPATLLLATSGAAIGALGRRRWRR